MPIQATMTVPGRSFIHKYQRTSFPIAKVPRVKLTMEFELTARGKIKASKILENPEFDADVLDDIQPINQQQIRRRVITSTPRSGQTRVFAYLLTTKDYKVESQVQLRYKWAKQFCQQETPSDAARPWAKYLYQYRVRHVVHYKFKIDREMQKYSTGTGWTHAGVTADPRGLQEQRAEGAWSPYMLLKPQLSAAPCVDPGADENYRTFQAVSTMPSITIYTV